MKKFLFLTLITLLAVACKPDEPKAPFQIDPLATIDIKPDMKGWAKSAAYRAPAEQQHLSPLEIVEQTTVIQIYNPDFLFSSSTGVGERLFLDEQRDLNPENPKLMMYGRDIISEEGEYTAEFIEARNIILISFDPFIYDAPRDTIAYIPNGVMQAAEVAIKQAFEQEDTEEIYRLFNEAFTFLPVTGAEYKALKLAGNQ